MIRNGKNTKLNKAASGVPQMGDTLRGWFRPLVFQRATTTYENFEAKQTLQDIKAEGVVQPMSAQQLKMMPEGERHWKWYTIHALTGLILMPGEYITYNDDRYRIVGRNNWEEYGYVEYTAVQEAK